MKKARIPAVSSLFFHIVKIAVEVEKMTCNEYKPALQEVVNVSKHVNYEWEQLKHCKGMLPEPWGMTRFDADPRGEYSNLYLTLFSLHARNLVDFFHEPRPCGSKNKVGADDVIASDFFDNGAQWVLPTLPGKDEAWLKTIRYKINKQTAHITYSRAKMSFEEKKWYVDELYDYLSALWDKFQAEASPRLFVK